MSLMQINTPFTKWD